MTNPVLETIRARRSVRKYNGSLWGESGEKDSLVRQQLCAVQPPSTRWSSMKGRSILSFRAICAAE